MEPLSIAALEKSFLAVAKSGKTLPEVGRARGTTAGRMKNVHEKTATAMMRCAIGRSWAGAGDKRRQNEKRAREDSDGDAVRKRRRER
jgi:hypothetical protein